MKIALSRHEIFRSKSGLNAERHRSGFSNLMYSQCGCQNPDCAVRIAVKRLLYIITKDNQIFYPLCYYSEVTVIDTVLQMCYT